MPGAQFGWDDSPVDAAEEELGLVLDGFEPFEVRGEEHRVDVAAVGWAADDVGDRDAFLLGAMEQVRGDAEFDPSRCRCGVRA